MMRSVAGPPPRGAGRRALLGGGPAGASPRAPFIALVVAVFLGGLTCLLGLNTISAADELRQQQIASNNSQTAAEVQQLQVTLAAKNAPAALARAASALGMVPAGNPAFLQIQPNGSVTLLGTPAAVVPPPIPLGLPAAGPMSLLPGGVTSTPAPTSSPSAPTPAPAPSAAPTAVPTTGGGAGAGTPTPVATFTVPGGSR